MKRIRKFVRFLTADPARFVASICILMAMGWVGFGKPVVPALVLLAVSAVCERMSLWRSLRCCAGPGGFLRRAFGFSLVTLVLRLTVLVVAGSGFLGAGISVIVAPLAVLLIPLPLAVLHVQHPRFCEVIYPASERILDARFRKLLLPWTAVSPLAELFCLMAVIALSLQVSPLALGIAGAVVAVFTVMSTRRFLASPDVNPARNSHVDEVAALIKAHAPEVVLYHSGPPESLYQYRMWASVLDRLSHKTLVVFRESGYLAGVMPTEHKTVYIRRFEHLYRLLPDSVKVILYAANGAANINMLRWHLHAEHVFINHGESDKAVNSNYFLTVYSRLFVSGQQAIDRFARCSFTIPPERFVIVGRPQMDALANAERPSSKGKILLYAPTWEGWNPLENYCSLEKMGVPLIEHLLKRHPDLKIVFKPHPFCGKNRPAVGAAVRKISSILLAAGGHQVISGGGDIIPHLAKADILITDVSSVANDFLATDRPLVMTDPLALGPDDFRSQFPTGEGAYLLDSSVTNIDAILEDAFGNDSMHAARLRVFDYSLGGFRGTATKAFDDALKTLCAEVAAKRLALQAG